MKTENIYLAELTEERENEAINRLFALSNRIPIDEDWKHNFDIELPYCTVGLRIPFQYIDPSLKKLEGDIDVLFLSMTNDIHDYFCPVTPVFDYIFAAEVKACYLTKSNSLKSAGLYDEYFNIVSNKQHKTRRQAKKLSKLGFDEVALFYFIATEPRQKYSDGMKSWSIASNAASTAKESVGKHLYVKETDSFSTCYFPHGSVPGGIETERGSIKKLFFKHKRQYKLTSSTAFRGNLVKIVKELFPYKVKNINNLPLLILACSDYSCKNLYVSEANPQMKCPECGSHPH